jgi:uncharacterized protein YjiS (DUF1127 family)
MIALMHAFFHAFGTWLLRRDLVQELHSLDDCILHDIGLSRCDINALVEGRTPYRGPGPAS